jgi:hypothetical protein
VPLSKAKKNEILFLHEGQRDALPSAISVLVSGRGFFEPAALTASPSLLPILVYETARLLARYPEFNGCYEEEGLIQWSEINVGVAFEIDAGLKVPIIKGADALGVDKIRETIEGHILKYLDKSLGIEDLSGGTFTITDLSNEKVFSFLPLINRRQSAILGMGGCQAFSETISSFPLTLTFDHRVSTGRRASLFLRELKERLEAYGSVLPGGATAGMPAETSCFQCRREEAELQDGQYLLVVRARGKAEHLCSTCLEGW